MIWAVCKALHEIVVGKQLCQHSKEERCYCLVQLSEGLQCFLHLPSSAISPVSSAELDKPRVSGLSRALQLALNHSCSDKVGHRCFWSLYRCLFSVFENVNGIAVLSVCWAA